jgi:hypothetical protein
MALLHSLCLAFWLSSISTDEDERQTIGRGIALIQLNSIPCSRSLRPSLTPQSKATMDAMDDETLQRLKEEIIELNAQRDGAKLKTFLTQEECNR